MDQQKLLTSSGELHLEIEMWDVGCGVDKYCSGESMWMIHKCFFMVWLWTFSFSLVWILSGCVLSLKDYSTPESIQRQQIFLSLFTDVIGDKSVFSLYVIHILPVAPNFFMSLTSFGAADEYKLQFLL